MVHREVTLPKKNTAETETGMEGTHIFLRDYKIINI